MAGDVHNPDKPVHGGDDRDVERRAWNKWQQDIDKVILSPVFRNMFVNKKCSN
jgi:hypothetical protein